MSNRKYKTRSTKLEPVTGSKRDRELLRWRRAIFVSRMPEIETLSGRPSRDLHEFIVAKLKDAGLVSETTNALDVNVEQLVQIARLLRQETSVQK